MSKNKTKKVKYQKSLAMVNSHSAGLDLHKETIWSCHLDDKLDAVINTFGTCTADVKALGNSLLKANVESVAMESTGVYWIPVYNILQSMGLKPVLINAREIKSVAGRPKTDKQDCMWICRLHSYGLLKESFVPDINVSALKNLCDCRDKIISDCSRTIQRIRKTLATMNCRLDKAVSDVMGVSGCKVIAAILIGEQNPQTLTDMMEDTLKMKKVEIVKELDGDFREVLIIVLKQHYELYQTFQNKIKELNVEIVRLLEERFPKKADIKDLPNKKKGYTEKQLGFNKDLRPILFEIFGTDLTQLPGIGALTVLYFLGVIGNDVSAWKTEKRFTSWLGLAPNLAVSANTKKKGKTKVVNNLLTKNLKNGAMATQRTDSYLGSQYRKFQARRGGAIAKTAIARKMAVILYNAVKTGTVIEKYDAEKYELKILQRKERKFLKDASILGYDVTKLKELKVI